MSAGLVPEYFAASALRMEAVGDAMVKNLKILTVLKLIMSNPQQQQPLHHRVDLFGTDEGLRNTRPDEPAGAPADDVD